MATQTKSRTDRTQDRADETTEQIRDLNERWIDSGRRIGETYLEAYERGAHSVANFQDRLGATSQVEWVSAVAHAQADFTRELAGAYSSAARTVLVGADRK